MNYISSLELNEIQVLDTVLSCAAALMIFQQVQPLYIDVRLSNPHEERRLLATTLS